MGSPSTRLNVPEHLRPWYESGLEYVYYPGGVPVSAEQAQPTTQSGAPQNATQPSNATNTKPPVQSTPAPGKTRPHNTATPQKQSSPKPASQPTNHAVATTKFPAPWDKFFSMTPPTPKVVWTYMELGLDLDGHSDPKRASVLRNLLGHHLKWPKGTAAFWPVAALNNDTLQPNANMFWKGWEQWKTPFVACFGEEALQVILPQAEPGKVVHIFEHVTIHVLPSLTQLVTMLPHEQQLSIDALAGIRI